MSTVDQLQTLSPSKPNSRSSEHDDTTAATASQPPAPASDPVVAHTPLVTPANRSLNISNLTKRRHATAQPTSPEVPSTTIARDPSLPERLRLTFQPSGPIRRAKEMSLPPTGSPKPRSIRSTSIAAPSATRATSPFTSNDLLGDKHGTNADSGLLLGLDNTNPKGINSSSLRKGMVADSNRYSPDLAKANPSAYTRASGGDGRSSIGKRSGTTLNERVDYGYDTSAKQLRIDEPPLARSFFLNEGVR
jgi:hypothetical protein